PRPYYVSNGNSSRLADRRLQQGHLGKVLARATMRRRRMVAIEFGVCRSGRIGGACGSVTVGSGRSVTGVIFSRSAVFNFPQVNGGACRPVLGSWPARRSPTT